MKPSKRIGVLTGGGDCPGLNAAIRSVTRNAWEQNMEVYGIEEGFFGLYKNLIRKIEPKEVSGILPRGGTFLKSSRFNPCKDKKLVNACLKNYHKHKLEGLIVIGGDGSLAIGLDFWQKLNIPILGIPKTIDNDVYGTEYCIGFFTAVQTAVDAIDKLHTTAESHNFVMIVEVMGRHCGYLAAYAGLAGGGDFILIPEKTVSIQELVKSLKDRHKSGKNFSIVVIAEDAQVVNQNNKAVIKMPTLKDEYGHIKLSGAGVKLQAILQTELGFEIRSTVLGHIQRGGSPVAIDRLLATAMGYRAIELVKKDQWGRLLCYDKGVFADKDLSVIHEGKKKLPLEFYDMAKTFFG